MKKPYYCKCALLTVALGFTMFAGCETTSTGASSSTSTASTTATADSGRLIIRRIADIGMNVTLKVSIDGKKVGTVVEGQDYSASLSPGPHIVTVTPEPNNTDSAPAQKRITVQKGQTYAFTAAWKGDALVLQ